MEGIYFFLFVVKVYNINTKMHMYHFISWGIFILLDVNYYADSETPQNWTYDFSSRANFLLLMFRFTRHHG